MENCQILSNDFSVSRYEYLAFVFILLVWYITLVDFECLNNLALPEKYHLVMVHDFFVFFWRIFGLLVFCWGFFHSYSQKILVCSFFFFFLQCLWFWHLDNSGITDLVWKLPSSSIFWRSYEKLLLIILQILDRILQEAIWFWAFLGMQDFDY